MSTFTGHAMVGLAAVREAGALCEVIRRDLAGAALQKQDHSPVTVADFASQALVCSRLQRAFPDIPIVAEESSSMLREDAAAPVRARVVQHVRSVRPHATEEQVLAWLDAGSRAANPAKTAWPSLYWTLDPIDGTKGFLRGDQYAVALGLVKDGRVVAAAMACPHLLLPDWSVDRGLMAAATAGGGVDLYGLRHAEHLGRGAVSQELDPLRMRMCESVESAHTSHDQSIRVVRQTGIGGAPVRMDSQAKYMTLAAGAAEVYLRLPKAGRYEENIWDHAAGSLLVEEAGGRVTDVFGRPLDFNRGETLSGNTGIVASHGPLHDELVAALST
jgi:3'(2'), 5'-bisphosphate nucleotidase